MTISLNSIKRIADDLLEGIPYLYTNMILGIFDTIFLHYNIELNDNNVEIVKEAVIEHFAGPCEPEWLTMEGYDWWNGLNAASFKTLTYQNTSQLAWVAVPPKGPYFASN